jgi:alkylation response protein AidB-like acyl-CoA dehydrogenase
VDWVYSEEQEELGRTVRRFLRERQPMPAVRQVMETEAGYDPAVWRQLAGQLGLVALGIPEEYGGAGFGQVELGIVLRELGHGLYPGPYFGSAVLAANALVRAGDEAAKKDLLPGIASGETIGTLAWVEDAGRWDLDAVSMMAATDGEGHTLTGRKNFVIDGQVAGLILVAARTAAGLSLFAVAADAPGLSRAPLPALDPTRRLARLDFDNVPASLIGTEGAAAAGLTAALRLAAVALAAEQIGGADACLRMSVAYAKERVQFGRPIGSFQAVKHKLADMHMEIELAKSAVLRAAWAADHEPAELPAAASLAKAYASEAYWRAAVETIQVHGGIGFTWEHDPHLYFKRAKTSQVLLGDPAYHRELLARGIGLGAAAATGAAGSAA